VFKMNLFLSNLLFVRLKFEIKLLENLVTV